MIVLLSYFIVINLVSFHLYRLDKRRAEQGDVRIPEFVLLGIAFLGGALGAFCAMHEYRHKTQHSLFFIGVPVTLVIQSALMMWGLVHCIIAT